MYTKRAELKAGLVVLTAIFAILALLYFAGGAEPIWGDYRYVHLRFEPGYVAPKAGDEVKMLGVHVGRVTEVRQAEQVYEGDKLTPEVRARLGIREPALRSAREFYVLAIVKLPVKQVIPRGTTAMISTSVTGTRTLALLPGFSLEDLTDSETRDQPIAAREAPGLTEITERLDDIAAKVEALVDGGSLLIGDARGVVQVLRTKIEAVDTEGLTDDLKAGLASLRRTLEGLEQRVTGIADTVASAANNLDRMTASGADTVDQVKADMKELLTTLKGVAVRLDKIMADAQPRVQGILSDFQVTASNMKRLSAEFYGIGPDARALLRDLGSDAGELMKTLKDTARNFLDASEDLRANPWKLLNEPSADQIAFQNLRNATLNYERAMRELNEASGRLTKLLQSGQATTPQERAAVANALGEFQSRLRTVRSTEARFLQLLREGRK